MRLIYRPAIIVMPSAHPRITPRSLDTPIKTSLISLLVHLIRLPRYTLDTQMASILLLRRPILSPLTLGLGLGLTTLYAAHSLQLHRPQRLLCDSSPTLAGSFRTYQQEAKVPVVRNGRPNPAAYKQISSGSILGTSESCVA